MPTTVSEIFNKFNIQICNNVKWGEKFNDTKQGIYIISTSDNPQKHFGAKEKIIFDDEQIDKWINKLPNFRIDKKQVNSQKLKDRLNSFWLADESILYIGKAPKRKNGSGISKRVSEYFTTDIGDSRPHSGGQWIKVLKHINDLIVYYGYCDNPTLVELKMLIFFMTNVSEKSLSKLHDKSLPLPFANIRCGADKKHGLNKQRE